MDLAIIISIGSAFISLFALGWNVYRDVVLKSRVRGSISLSKVYHSDFKSPTYISISVVNLGPNTIYLSSIYIAKLSLFRVLGQRIARLFNKGNKYAHVMWDYTNEYSSKLPISLAVGEQATFLLEATDECCLSMDPSHVGVTDTFGRFHWVNSQSLKLTKNEFFSTHSKTTWGEA
ncbi:hypothetical protein [Vibrio parahaemolyticus]|uniref:hypothetical protein n=1 Tax=Vibrio parahaemolyticus TaxID=670 RepID=UPI001A8C36DE|nr:hypothetical protein [Vibrio parahaemolyticus]MBO0170248.1 hypothetical protein [Vibrio parahaemolyticus]MDF4755579.1 hypothetical protein [Vibrio parahaemolyticus]MDF4781824.1 hypothetical protein [Vibrio parahaemolyticus]MDF4786655.1 hypothetical protein [Vibrio parahaemolyticus]MDF4825404.1 hypothetical protein [Vibrio parahaemolyticus]